MKGRVSIVDYLAGEEISEVKHEYIDGEIHAMPSANNRHSAIATNVLLLGVALRGKPYQAFNSATKIRIEFADHVRFYYPDALVVLHSNPGSDHFQNHPVVVVEVLSEFTRRTDLVEKRAAYLGIPSLKVLLLVETQEPGVVVHRRRSEGGFEIESYLGLGEVIPLPEIDTSLALSELFERVEFA